jgi:hypothetical protein
VVRLTGVRRKTLNNRAERGFVTPSVVRKYGAQRVRLWSFADLVALRVLQRLHEVGLDFHADRPVRLLARSIQDRQGLQNVSLDTYLSLTAGRSSRRGATTSPLSSAVWERASAWVSPSARSCRRCGPWWRARGTSGLRR